MFVLGNLIIALVIVVCDAGVIHDAPVLEYGVKAVPEGAYKPVIGYPEGAVPKALPVSYGLPGPLPVAYGLPGPLPVAGVVKDVGALPYGATVGGLKPFGSYRSLFSSRFPLHGREEVIAPGLGYGVAPIAAPVKEVKEYTPPIALREYTAPVVLKEYAPKVVLKEYTAPVALREYAAPAVGYPSPGYAGYNVPGVAYDAPGGYVAAIPVKGYPAPVAGAKQEGYGLVKKFDW